MDVIHLDNLWKKIRRISKNTEPNCVKVHIDDSDKDVRDIIREQFCNVPDDVLISDARKMTEDEITDRDTALDVIISVMEGSEFNKCNI